MCVVYNKIFINLNAASMTGPTQPTQAGNFSFLGCWTDEKDDRTLSPAGSTGAIDVDTCASFCDDYEYMGTEYSDECKLVMFCPKPSTGQLGSAYSRPLLTYFTQAIVEICRTQRPAWQQARIVA